MEGQASGKERKKKKPTVLQIVGGFFTFSIVWLLSQPLWCGALVCVLAAAASKGLPSTKVNVGIQLSEHLMADVEACQSL